MNTWVLIYVGFNVTRLFLYYKINYSGMLYVKYSILFCTYTKSTKFSSVVYIQDRKYQYS